MMVGRTLDELYPRGARAAGEPMLQLDGVDAGRRRRLTLRRGEILGIAGLLGAGRTRLLRAIFGLEPVTSGAITVGAYSGPATPHDRWRQGMGMLSEDRAGEGLALGLSVADNMTLTRLEPSRAGVRGAAVAAGRGGGALDRSARHPLRGRRARRSASCRAATSRRWRSRGCCTTMSTCSCSTSRRAASTSRARRRSTS